ncbi:acetylornithine deacetylase [Ramlibacter sp.]|uniref:acetylornithine deacetylase n=1 Tax=Ramlibacter sp. TaxID=1917967 RepID=UPI0017931126|nr:acetylornithine deacetylase [Ramlibacter sp.]MBA2673333.1 acetylornithine deacetylase [Ramlibacter sp.]
MRVDNTEDAREAQQVLQLLQTLVAFDTTSARSNLDCLHWIADHAQCFNPRVRFTYSADGSKANLLLSFGPDVAAGVVLSAHTDTVPVDGQPWSAPPFEARQRGARVYGRGTSDMKGFIAACLAALPHWHREGLARPIHLALSYDEEIGCVGVPRLLDDFSAHVPPPALVWVGEPTGMRIATTHKGVCVFRTEFFGRDAHSSLPQLGHSAIADAVRFAHFLLALGVEAAERTTRVPGLLPPYTTLNIGRIEGGAALNMVARRCVLEWEFRAIPEDDMSALRQRIDDFLAVHATARVGGDDTGAPPAGAVAHDATVVVPPLRPDAAQRGLELLRRVVGDKPEIAVPFGTEAGHFQLRGWPTVVCGPGAIEQAHQPDEWIEVAQLAECVRALRRLPAFLASPG